MIQSSTTDDDRSRPDVADFAVWIIVAVYLCIATIQLQDSLIIDEIEFPRLAEAIADTGRPIYYRGEQSPAHIGVFHPPLYAYSMGAWIAVFGFSEATVRAFGVLVMLATAMVAVRIVQYLGLAGRWGSPVFLGLFLLHPYVIQSALLPDIDGTVLLLATMAVLLVTTRSLDEQDWRRSATCLGLALALAFATKLTAILLVPTALLGLALARGLKWSLRVVALGSIVGLTVFLFGWWLLAAVADLPFAYPFEFLVQSGLKGGVAESGWSALLSRLIPQQSTTFWLGPFLPLGALAGTAALFVHWRVDSGRRMAILFVIWSAGIFAFYSLITGPPFGFPKYMIAAVPGMAILCVVAVDATTGLGTPRRRAAWASITAIVGLGVLWSWRFAISADDGPYSLPAPHWVFVLVALSIVAGLASIRLTGTNFGPVFAIALLIASLSYGAGTSAVQAFEESSIRYFPGEVGFDETVQRLKELTTPEDMLLVPKDIGSAVYNRYHEQELLFRDLNQLAAVLADPSVSHAVVRIDWDYSYKVFPEVEQVIEEHMDLSETIGGFLIYARTST